jgi:hypothetical protein
VIGFPSNDFGDRSGGKVIAFSSDVTAGDPKLVREIQRLLAR